ncbi:MAG: transposase [Rhodospirillales bacterium]|nr:transposase [Rhodospirillales bacterium]MCY4003224.1 transposase [Rhodospirillales bacterium]
MRAERTPAELCFEGLDRCALTGRFGGGRPSPNGDGILLREMDLRLGLTARLADCFTDYRPPASVEHGVLVLVAQQIYGLAPGYEDHTSLWHDALMPLPVRMKALNARILTNLYNAHPQRLCQAAKVRRLHA